MPLYQINNLVKGYFLFNIFPHIRYIFFCFYILIIQCFNRIIIFFDLFIIVNDSILNIGTAFISFLRKCIGIWTAII